MPEKSNSSNKHKQGLDKAQQYLDLAGVMFVALDTKGEVTLINKKGCQVLGYKEDEVIGKNWFENFVPERISAEILPISKKLLAGEIKTAEYYENPVLTKNGKERMIAWHNSVIRDESGRVVGHLSSGEDITERKQADEEIRNLSAAVEQSIGGVAMADTDKRITYVNPAYARMHGYDVDEMTGMEIKQLNHLDYIPTANEHVDMIKKHGWAVYQSEHIRKDGTLFMIQEVFSTLWDETGDGKAYLLIAEDITEQKKMENELQRYSENLEQIVDERTQELKSSEDRYLALFNNANDAVLVYNRAPSGLPDKCIDANDVACRMFGYTREELRGKTPRDISDSKMKHDFDAIRKSLNEKGHVVFESVRVTKDGRKVPVEISSYVFEHEDEPTIVSLARDISDRKKAAKKLDETQQKLVRAEKLAAIGQLASGIAHELRNQLAVINNAAYFLKMKMGGEDAIVDKHLGIMEREVFRSSGIIAGLLDFARTREPLSEKVDLDAFVEDILSKLAMPKGVNMAYKLQLDGLVMSIDIEQIKRVLLNIINNAIQAMPDGGNLTIQTQQSDGFIEVEVSDTGVGISQKDLRRIFEPLFTTRSDKGGTGIGLSICKSIVEAHHGSIKVKSSVGEGTMFTVRLPAAGR